MNVVVLPHDPAWGAKFAGESARVMRALASTAVAIHHIGSTSIAGIYAKPVIDLLAEVRTIDDVDARNDALRGLGYHALGEYGIAGRRYFRKDSDAGVREYQLHVFAAGSTQVARHLAFRDFMRAHADVAAEYSDLKRRLADENPQSIDGYMDGKDGFVKQAEQRALAWRNGGSAGA